MKERIISWTVISALVLGVAGFGMALPLALKTTMHAPALGGFSPVGAGTYLLQSSISATQSTITLTSFAEPGSNIPYTMSYIGSDILYGTINPSSGNSEFISATGITQNTNGTATLTGVIRGESRTPGTGGCVASSTLAHGYPGQTQFILSNTPCFYSEYAVKRNNENIGGAWNFNQYPAATSTIGNATTSRQFITLGQAQGLANQGAATGTESIAGIVRLATPLQAASSTNLGVDNPTVLASKNATSSPNGVASALFTLILNNAGKIAQSALDIFSTTNIWSGLNTFSNGILATASSTFSSTMNIKAANVSTSPLNLNGVPYAFPAAQCLSGQILQDDGSGNWSCVFSPHLLSYATSSTVTIGGNGVATSSFFTIPSGLLTGSSTIEIRVGNSTCTAGGGGSGTCNVSIRTSAGIPLATITLDNPSSGASANNGWAVIKILMNNSLASEYVTFDSLCFNNGTYPSNCGQNNVTATTVDLSGTPTLAIVFSASANIGSASAVFTGYSIVVNP